jgi:hypothetical protein
MRSEQRRTTATAAGWRRARTPTTCLTSCPASSGVSTACLWIQMDDDVLASWRSWPDHTFPVRTSFECLCCLWDGVCMLQSAETCIIALQLAAMWNLACCAQGVHPRPSTMHMRRNGGIRCSHPVALVEPQFCVPVAMLIGRMMYTHQQGVQRPVEACLQVAILRRVWPAITPRRHAVVVLSPGFTEKAADVHQVHLMTT